MPAVKKSAKKKNVKPARKPARAKQPRVRAAPPRAPSAKYSDEYREYLERYEYMGEGRPRLSPVEFDRLDDELLDLLVFESEIGLDDEQIVRKQELEYLLLDSEQ
jgi:hypothetical protein